MTRAVADTVLIISFVVLVALCGIWFAVFGVKYTFSQLRGTSLGSKGIGFLSSEWGKGLIVFTSLPLILIVLALDYCNQFVRRKTFLGKRVDDDEREKKFTPRVDKARQKIKRWEKGSVIPKALVVGIFYFTLSVGVQRITVVFLSALKVWLSGLNLVITSFILVAVGLLLFLIPVIPGVPVYITLGVVLPAAAEKSLGLVGGIFYAIALSFVLKLIAVVVQQKIIGELWGSNNVWVRQTVQVNSVEIRATKKILEKPGLNIAKVVILCGGPDWPTSVLTGIMRLNVFQMLLGTVPVLLLIAPTVVSGALAVKAAENELFSTLYTVALVLTVIVQSASLLWAVQVIAATAVSYEAELQAEEPDEEVLERERQNNAKVEEFKNIIEWEELSFIWKTGHIVSLVLMIVSGYGFLLMSGLLFESFEIQNTIGEQLGGNVFNLVKPLGWVFLAMFALSTAYYFAFSTSFKKRVVRSIADGDVEDLGQEIS